jgi:DNA-binding SARP family transcriptional activator
LEPLILRLLGRQEVSCGRQLLRFRSRKELALVFYLATEGGLHPREKLAALLWPEAGEDQSRASLRNALYGLRKTLKGGTGQEYLRAGHDSAAVGLDLGSGVELDLRLLDAAFAHPLAGAREGEIRLVREELRAAAAVYRGEFLAGFSLDDAPDFEYWVSLERERWLRRSEAVFDRLSGLELGSGEVGAAVATAERWTHHAPASEAAYRRLMEAYFAAGNGAAALRAFEACRRVLQEGLGVEPSAETGALAARIRAEAFSGSTAHQAWSGVPGATGPPRGDSRYRSSDVQRSSESSLRSITLPGGARGSSLSRARLASARRASWSSSLAGRSPKGLMSLRGRPSRLREGCPTGPWSAL